MYRRLLYGCPCTLVPASISAAICDHCGMIFPVDSLLHHADGSLFRVPCDKIAMELEPAAATHTREPSATPLRCAQGA